MKTKKVTRYYCEYCKKSGCVARWIKKHEERCTMNPNRYCGFCHLRDMPQPKIAKLLKLLPNPKEYEYQDSVGEISYTNELHVAIEKALPKLRNAAEGCPACILAALRQKGIPVPLAEGFNYTKESQEIWDEFNAAKMEEEIYSDYSY